MSPVTFSLLSSQNAKSLSWGTLLGAVLLGSQQCQGAGCWKDPAPPGTVVALPLTGLWGWCLSGSLTACVFSWWGAFGPAAYVTVTCIGADRCFPTFSPFALILFLPSLSPTVIIEYLLCSCSETNLTLSLPTLKTSK